MLNSYLLSFAVCLLGCWVIIVLFQRLEFFRVHNSNDLLAAQASHKSPTPRQGGAVAGLCIGLFSWVLFAQQELAWRELCIVLSAIPVFILGVKEDIFRNVRSSVRFLAAIVSGVVAFLLTGMWINFAEPEWFGGILAYSIVGVPLTILTSSGFSHAFNLLDGLNGLTSGMSVLISAGLVFIAQRAGVLDVLPLLWLVIATLMGFLAWNFPRGLIFLGDGGAYALGHVLSWISIVLIFSSDELSAWSIMLVFFWPFTDTMFTILRRVFKGNAIHAPDRVHFHQVLMRVLLMVMGAKKSQAANPLATVVILALAVVPVAIGVVFWNNAAAAGAGLVGTTIMFVAMYYSLKLAIKRRWRLNKRHTLIVRG